MSQPENPLPPGPARAGGILTNPAFLCAVIMLLTLAVRLPLLNIPFERDEGEYAYIGWRMGLHELPYRDWVDQKPPGIFWVYALALQLPWNAVCAVHLAGALFAAASAGALFLLARRFLEPFWAVLAGLLLGLLAADPTVQGNAANTEVFMQLPILLSLLALFRAASGNGSRTRYMILSGVLAGLAALFKQVAAFHWIFLALAFPLFCGEEKRFRQALAFAFWSAGGAVAVWAVVAGYFLLEHGWHDFLYNVFLHNLDYIDALSPASRRANLNDAAAGLAKSHAFLWIFSIVGGAFAFVARPEPHPADDAQVGRGSGRAIFSKRTLCLYLLLWLTTAAVGVNASGYFFPHYFQPLLPVLALAAAAGAASLDEARGWAHVPAGCRRAALVLALALLPGFAIWPFLFRYTPAEAASRIYPGNPFAQMPALGRRLAEITRPEDRVFIFGSEPELLFYARRASATRYIFLFPLFGPYADAEEKQKAVTQEIIRARPAAAFYLPNGLFYLPGSKSFLATWSFDYLHQNFRADSWLTVDAAGVHRVLTAQPEGKQPTNSIGELMIRKAAPVNNL